MAKIYYHNITKRQLNETCIIDLIDQYNEGDMIYKSYAGNSLIYEVSEREIKELKHQHKEYHENN